MTERMKFVLEWQRGRRRGKRRAALPRVRDQPRNRLRVAAALPRRWPRCPSGRRAFSATAHHATAFDANVADLLVAARKKYPFWGPRKLTEPTGTRLSASSIQPSRSTRFPLVTLDEAVTSSRSRAPSRWRPRARRGCRSTRLRSRSTSCRRDAPPSSCGSAEALRSFPRAVR